MINTTSASVKKLVVFSLFIILFIDGLGVSLTLPLFAELFLLPKTSILPLHSSVEIRNFFYGLSLMSFSLGMFLGSPILGQLSDRFGRKKILVFSLIGTFVGYLTSGVGVIIRNPNVFILGRVIDGLSAGSIPIAQAAIADVSTKENKVGNLGLILFAVTSGYIVGPLFAEFLVKIVGLGLSVPFYATAILSCASLLLLLPMKESLPLSSGQKINWLTSLNIVHSFFKVGKAFLVLLGFLFFQLAWNMYFQFLPHLLTMKGESVSIALILACIGVGMAISFCFLTKYFQTKITAKIGSFFSISTVILAIIGQTFLFTHVTFYFLTAFIAASGYGLAYSFLLAYISEKIAPALQGTIMGVAASMSALSAAVTGLMGILLVDISSEAVVFFCLFCALASLLLLLIDLLKNVSQIQRRA